MLHLQKTQVASTSKFNFIACDVTPVMIIMSLPRPVFALAAGIQSYDWGKKGSSSKAAQYAHASGLPGFAIDEEKPYAEVRGIDLVWNERGRSLSL